MRNTLMRSIVIVIGLMLIVGCRGTMQVGIERTPTPDRSIPATLTALHEENNRLATRVAEQVEALPSSIDLGQLAYVQGGDIWIIPLLDEAARPRRLTTDGYNREPRWSPSGKWLAYRKERPVAISGPSMSTQGSNLSVVRRQVWVMQADGTGNRPLNQGQSVEVFAWSPQGDRLAYASSGGGLYIINADGTDLISLITPDISVSLGEQQIGRISWRPDGRSIAYEWRIQPISRPMVRQELRIVSVEDGAPLAIYNADILSRSEVVLAGWSSRGNEMLFVQDRSGETYGISPLGSGQLYALPVGLQQATAAAPQQVDYAEILPYADFVAPNPPLPFRQEREAVALVAGQNQGTWTDKRIKSAGQFVTGEDLAAISPAWSPQGNRLAFAAMPDVGDPSDGKLTILLPRRIYTANAVGDPQLHALTNLDAYRDERPLWSSDGNYLLFARFDAKSRASLWVISSGGGVPRQVVDELTPAPDPLESFGHVSWDAYYDWWRRP